MMLASLDTDWQHPPRAGDGDTMPSFIHFPVILFPPSARN
jgi:hypothetical protein